MKVRHKGRKRRRRCGGGYRVGGWWAGFIRMEEHQSRVNGKGAAGAKGGDTAKRRELIEVLDPPHGSPFFLLSLYFPLFFYLIFSLPPVSSSSIFALSFSHHRNIPHY